MGSSGNMIIHHLLQMLKPPCFPWAARSRVACSFEKEQISARRQKCLESFPFYVWMPADGCRKGFCLWPLPCELQEKIEGGSETCGCWETAVGGLWNAGGGEQGPVTQLGEYRVVQWWEMSVKGGVGWGVGGAVKKELGHRSLNERLIWFSWGVLFWTVVQWHGLIS